MTKTRVAILGATGYTASELIHLFARHPYAEITALTTRSEDRPHVADVHPSVRGLLDLYLEPLTDDELAARADCVFCCLPHKASADRVPGLLDRGMKVIDLSADYRLDDAQTFTEWYGETHPDPDRLGKTPYGLPELFRDKIVGANLVANPGCYPTSSILPLTPLLLNGYIKPEDIIIDSKSGTSGAGKSLKPGNMYCTVNENFLAYGVGTHRHRPEIEQVIARKTGTLPSVIFTPHLVAMDRGIFTTTYSLPAKAADEKELIACLRDFYKNEQFVRVMDTLPSVKAVAHTNFCDMTVRVVRNRVMTLSCIDNLVKGASGAALQNFNILYGYPENTALI